MVLYSLKSQDYTVFFFLGDSHTLRFISANIPLFGRKDNPRRTDISAYTQKFALFSQFCIHSFDI